MNPAILVHAQAAVLAERLTPFLDAGALTELDAHTVDTLGSLAGENNPDVLLALALAVRAPARGHICVDLAATQADSLLPEDADEALHGTLSLPAARAAWIETVQNSPLVGAERPFQLEGSWLYATRYHTYEQHLAAGLRQRMTEQRPLADAALLGRGLSTLFSGDAGGQRQQLAAAMAAVRGFTVLSGGPGTGKTYTVSRILTLLWAQWAQSNPDGSGPRVALAAPTGKAAARMKESIVAGQHDLLRTAEDALPRDRTTQDLGGFLADLTPTTLHRLLGWQPRSPTRFRHNASNPLPHDIVIVDEASMVDVALMAKLVDAVRPDARLLLLGDKNQLASVEAGSVLADIAGPVQATPIRLSERAADELRAAGLTLPHDIITTPDPGPQDSVVLLTHSHRFRDDSGIGQFAQLCLAPSVDAAEVVRLLDTAPDTHLYAHKGNGQLPDDVLNVMVAAYTEPLTALLRGPAAGQALDAFHRAILERFGRFRVLAAHRRGNLGVDGLNRTLEAALTERIDGFDATARHYLGRPVLVRRNDPVVGRYNGDIGLIVNGEDNRPTAVFLGEHGVEYLAPARLPEHQTVFAMTIHKSQGSEFDHAFVVLPDTASPLLTRELVYTGVTRAKTQMSLLSDREVLAAALGRTVQRASGLRRKLWEST